MSRDIDLSLLLDRPLFSGPLTDENIIWVKRSDIVPSPAGNIQHLGLQFQVEFCQVWGVEFCQVWVTSPGDKMISQYVAYTIEVE